MPDEHRKPPVLASLRFVFWLLIGIWTGCVAGSLSWSLHQQESHRVEIARRTAQITFENDALYRRWAARQGGVYVRASGDTPPNPYLGIPERDVTTTSGLSLTLVNPAYMVRQVNDLAGATGGSRGHLTSLRPIRPENAPDPWETAALRSFEQGASEVSSVEEMSDGEYLRLMRPFIVEQGCLKCHAAQGYREGDIRGGISVSVPMAPLRAIERPILTRLTLAHMGLWLVGLAGIALFRRTLGKETLARQQANEELRESEERVRRKLASVLDPEGDLGALDLADLIDVKSIQGLMDNFYQVAHVPMSILDARGRVLVGVGWQEICTEFHRAHPETAKRCVESDTKLTMNLAEGEFRSVRCKNGMRDMATPIFVGGRCIGGIFSDQFFLEGETPDREAFRGQARRYGFDEEAYLAALDRVPRLSQATVDRGMAFFLKLAQMFSRLGYSYVKLARLLAERHRLLDEVTKGEQSLNRAQAIAHLGSWELDLAANRLTWSDEVYRIFGLEPRVSVATYEAFLERVHPVDRATVDAAYWGSVREGKDSYEIEHRVVRKDSGEIRWVHERCQHLRDAEGRVIRSMGMVLDITEGKRAKDALRSSNERLELLATVAERLLRAEDPQKIVDDLCRLVMARLDCQLFFNYLVEVPGRRLSLNAFAGIPAEAAAAIQRLDFGVAVCGCVARDGQRTIAEDIQHSENRLTELVKSYGAQAYCCHPLLAQGEVIGTLSFGTRTRPAFTADEVALMKSVADQIAVAMQRVLAEQALRQLAQFPDKNPNVVLQVGADESLVYANAPAFGWLKSLGWQGDGPLPSAVLRAAGQARGQGRAIEIEISTSPGATVWISAVQPAGEDYVNLYGRDITDRKTAEVALRESEEKARSAFANAAIGFAMTQPDGRFVDANPAYSAITGYGVGELRGLAFSSLIHPDDYAENMRLTDRMLAGQIADFVIENRYVRKGGGPVWVRKSVSLVRDMEGAPRWIIALVEDITDRKEVEERIRRSLAEKEVLLKEIHHRVKNNMQVISSLVALQAERLPDVAMRSVFQDVAHRVRSMALVHEKLYQSADMSKVEFAEYTRSLLSYLWRAHGMAAANVRLALDLEPVPLSVNAAVPCGLILNELVSNALKHAFRGRAAGEVAVCLRGGPEGSVRLQIRDNGVGLPAELDWRQADSLGLRLVQMLVGQLHASVECSRNEGTEFTVTFGGPKKNGNGEP